MVAMYINFQTLSTAFLNTLRSNDSLSVFFKEVLTNQARPNYLFLTTDNSPALKYQIQDMIIEQFKYDRYSPVCSLSWLKIFFANVMRTYTGFQQYSDCGSHMDFGPVLSYISANYRTSSLNEIAEHFNYSDSYLSGMIRKVTGKTYTQIVKEYKLMEAREYLLHTAKPISEIAQLCGYNDTDHFFRTFREVHGCSPRQYRKQKEGREETSGQADI